VMAAEAAVQAEHRLNLARSCETDLENGYENRCRFLATSNTLNTYIMMIHKLFGHCGKFNPVSVNYCIHDIDIVCAMILQDMTSVLLVFHLIREHLIGLALDLGQDKCAKNHILFVLLIKKLVSTLTVCYTVISVILLH